MNRRDFLKNCFAVTAGCAMAGSASSIAGTFFSNKSVKIAVDTIGDYKKPNILFFFTDDQRFSLINALGTENVITPTMDSFVKNGVTFKNCYVMGSSSGAVCKPSRAMLVTGRNIFSISGDGATIPTSHKMIQEALDDSGYNTYLSGKWHNGSDSAARGFNVAKNVFFGGMSDQYNTPFCNLLPGGTWSNSVKSTTHSSEVIASTAVEFLESQRTLAEPFFMYVPFKAPHDPRDCPQKYMDMYNLPNGQPDPDKVKVNVEDNPFEEDGLPPNYASRHPSDSEEEFDTGALSPDDIGGRIRDEKLAGYPRNKAEILSHIRDYYAITSHLDEQIGRVMEKLEDIGQAENTIIVFAGDNGLAVGQHALMGKQDLYHHSIGVPLVISGRGIPKEKSTESFCYLFDIFPTICDLVGVDIPGSVQGMSLAPILKDQNHVNRETMYFPYKDFIRAVRDERYKLIEYNVDGDRNTQLFDMQEDPWEKNNLASNPAYATKLNELRTELIRLKNEYNDTSSFWTGY